MLAGIRWKRPIVLIPSVVVLLITSYHWLLSPRLPHSWFSYATRPVWDRDPAPTERILQYSAEGVGAEQLCELHGFKRRNEPVQIWDAAIFSTELDLLLIRLHELSPVVDTFFLLESTTTFTGLPKPLILRDALATSAFDPYRAKIKYQTVQGRTLAPGESPFAVENEQRWAMTLLIKEHYPPAESGVPPPVLLESDVDEIVSRRTARLLKACEVPLPLHLGLRDYMYSFEFDASGDKGGASSWRASANRWMERGHGSDEIYRHGKQTEKLLVDSGWHCSWCFRTIAEFVTKATGYSHVDRLGNRPSALLRPSSIQETICAGSDIFHMLPEAYTWREMVRKWRLLKSSSLVNVPSLLVEQPDRFKYLLPGGCVREDSPWRSE